MRKWRFILWLLVLGLSLVACRKGDPVVPTEVTTLGAGGDPGDVEGMWLLNEGNMGSNKSTLDYLDMTKDPWEYKRNYYSQANPGVVKELGDVGNDIAIYGNRLYLVINCSNKVEILHARTGKRIGKVDIPNCRYIKFKDSIAYVSSYVGKVKLGPQSEQQLGEVVSFDVRTMKIIARCQVGYQPDELCIVGDKIYVANSGGYDPDKYDNSVSVIALRGEGAMEHLGKITIQNNLFRCQADAYGHLWVTSRGDYHHLPSRLFRLDKDESILGYHVADTIDRVVTNMRICEDTLFCYGEDYSYIKGGFLPYGFFAVDTRTGEVIEDARIIDATHKYKHPYGIQVHPVLRYRFVTDAFNYVSSGTLHCYDGAGHHLWETNTGDIPAHMCFLYKKGKQGR